MCVCVCVCACARAPSLLGRGGLKKKKPAEHTESECRDCSSLTDVIPNTAPKCCVPPQILSEGLFKKQPHTTGLLCALFLIYSQHKFKAAAALHDLEETCADNSAVCTPDDKRGETSLE